MTPTTNLILSAPQRKCLEGLSNRGPQLPNDPVRDELAALALIEQNGPKWTLTAAGKKLLSIQSSKRNVGGFRV
ncbi:MAG: hypothetical protein HC788_09885 [Sphingopyxis sp.]|nr:hypothetical protein [Sphingopyxis sp.]